MTPTQLFAAFLALACPVHGSLWSPWSSWLSLEATVNAHAASLATVEARLSTLAALEVRLQALEAARRDPSGHVPAPQRRSILSAVEGQGVTRITNTAVHTLVLNTTDFHVQGKFFWRGHPVGFDVPTPAPSPSPTVKPSREPTLQPTKETSPATISSPLGGTVDVLCKSVAGYDAWDAASDGPWTLYLFNGADSQHRSQLSFSVNPGGFGSVSTMPATGGHKMGETLFDAFGFTELLAVGTHEGEEGWEEWVLVKPGGGGAFSASQVFATTSTAGTVVRRGDTGQAVATPASWGASPHGPLFIDNVGNGHTRLWTQGDDRKGTPIGETATGNAVTHFSWAWFGRGGAYGCDKA
jgi:hypothetical protein